MLSNQKEKIVLQIFGRHRVVMPIQSLIREERIRLRENIKESNENRETYEYLLKMFFH